MFRQDYAAHYSASGSEVATLINDYINRGAIVPVEITIGLIEKVGWQIWLFSWARHAKKTIDGRASGTCLLILFAGHGEERREQVPRGWFPAQCRQPPR